MSLRKAINEKCTECIYDPISGIGGKLQQIEACTCYSCPLYNVRPTSTKKRSISSGKMSCDHGMLKEVSQ